MNEAMLSAAMKERDLVVSEIEFLKELVEDPTFPEVDRMQSEMRMQNHIFFLKTLDGIIARQLNKRPIDVVLDDINNNLSTENH